jgi:hypothetical protein
MKKVFFSILLVSLVVLVNAQDIPVAPLITTTSKTVIKKEADTTKWNWKRGGLINFALAQGSLSNWAAGGDNYSLTVSSYFNYFLYYQKKRISWDNNLDVNLGYVQTTSLGSRKNDDRFDFTSKYEYKMDTVGKWYLSTLFDFRSQFFDGYTYVNDSGTFSSSFLSPAYALLSLGFDYKPTNRLSVFLSPLTSRLVIVTNDILSNEGAYGVDTGKHVKNQLGAFATINYRNEFFDKTISYKGRLDLFSNYLDQPQNINVFMTNHFSFKINKYFSATYGLDFIYDDKVLFGTAPNQHTALQTKSLLGIGFLKKLEVKKTVIHPTP